VAFMSLNCEHVDTSSLVKLTLLTLHFCIITDDIMSLSVSVSVVNFYSTCVVRLV